jgi:hypothetical protein
MLEDPWSKAALEDFNGKGDAESLYTYPERATESARSFVHEQLNIFVFIVMLGTVTVVADNARAIARKVLNKEELPRDFDATQPLETDGGPYQKGLRRLSPVVLQMLFARTIDNFESYLSEAVAECLHARPEALRTSGARIPIEMVFAAESLDELREELIDRRVNELSYLGFDKLSDWISEQLGVDDLRTAKARIALAEFLEVRNCIVHHRSRVSQRYLAKVRSSGGLRVGDKLDVTFDMVYLVARATTEVAMGLDVTLREKFELAEVRVHEPEQHTEG